MTTIRMRDQALRKVTCPAAAHGNLLTRWQTAPHKGAGQTGHVWPGRRVLRVMVLDEQQDSAEAIAGQVRRWGHTARSASDGIIALRMAAARHPDVVLLNLPASFLDGCRVARQLRRDFGTKECFIIACMEREDDECSQQCHAAGIDVLLVRPVDPSALETLLLLECVNVNRRRAVRADNNPRNSHEQLVGGRRRVPLPNVVF